MKNISLLIFCALCFIVNAHGQTADLTLDGSGIIGCYFHESDSWASAVGIDSNGKIVLIGATAKTGSGERDIGVARYNDDGSPDFTLLGNGQFRDHIPDSSMALDRSYKMGGALQPDGKIVAAMGAGFNQVSFSIIRYNIDGTKDHTFSVDGYDVLNVTEDDDIPSALILQPDGKILVGGNSYSSFPSFIHRWILVRYLTNGDLDSSFGTDGVITDSIGNYNMHQMALQPDGRIVLAGDSLDLEGSIVNIVRYTALGKRDSTFGINGITGVSFANGYARVNGVTTQPDNKVIITGSSTSTTERRSAMFRLNENGTPDLTFATGGAFNFDFSSAGNFDECASALIQDDGTILIAGDATNVFDQGIYIAHLSSEGKIDSSFANNGVSYCYYPICDFNTPRTMLMAPTGKLLMCGYSDYPDIDYNNFSAWRFNMDIADHTDNLLLYNTKVSVSPNPFSTITTVSFSLEQSSHTTITLLDVAGRKIKTLLDENLDAGNHSLNLNRDQFPSGIYFLQLNTNDVGVLKKVVID